MSTVSVSIAKETTSQEILSAVKKIPTTGGGTTPSANLDSVNVYICDFATDRVVVTGGSVDLNRRVICG